MINLTFLGCGGGMPMPNRFLSSMIINYKGKKILMDCGEGTQVAMRKNNSGFKNIDYICITHLHGDHIYGLPGLLKTMGNSERTEKVMIIGPKGITKIMDAMMVIMESLPFELIIKESPSEEIVIEDEIYISTIDLDHSIECIGYKFYFNRQAKFEVEKAMTNNVPKCLWGKLQKENKIIEYEGKKYTRDMVLGEKRKGISLVFMGDTRPTDDMVTFSKDSDLLICEGTYGDSDDIDKAIMNKHMTFEETATLAKKANVKRLILTHFSTALDEPKEYINNARKIFLNSDLAEDGYKTELKYESNK